MTVTIVIATYGRLSQFQQCLSSVLSAMKNAPQIDYQLFIGLNGRDEEADQWLTDLKDVHPFELICFEERLSPPTVRNRLIQHASGTWVCFIDDDAYPKEDYFSKFLETVFNFPECSVIGGPNLTPPDSSWFQKMTGTVLSSRLATFFSSRRYRPKGESLLCGEESLILCNLFVKQNALGAIPFPDDLVCCEEGWLLDTLKLQGFYLVYNPDLVVWHDRRSTLKSFVRQVFKYGWGRGQVLRRRVKLSLMVHLVPTICVLYSVGVFILTLFHRGSVLSFVPFLIYFPLCMVASFTCVQRDNFTFRKWFAAVGLFPVIHTTYGLGLAWGFIRK